jgi:transcriptional regulator with XRE-family HTH domain
MGEKHEQDPTMIRVRAHFKESGLTLHELGVKMGYPEETARKSAWQFIQKTDDPRLGTLRKFARAMGVSLQELIEDEAKKPKR